MPDSAVTQFSEPSEFEQSIRGTDLKAVVVGARGYNAELIRIDLHRVWAQHGRQSVPGICHFATLPGRAAVIFAADDNRSPAFVSGMELSSGNLIRYAAGAEHHFRMTGDSHWQTMSMTIEDLNEATRALVGCDLAPPGTSRVKSIPAPLISRLRKLHDAAAQLALTTPDILAHPEVANALEQELVRVLVACLTQGVEIAHVREGRVPVMRRFEEALEARDGQPAYLLDICREIGVSDRSLRLHCVEHLGMGPQRYLWLRRMNLARRALARAGGSKTTVTSIATEYGFCELGRFSVQYRKLFGETPSATLLRAPDEPGLRRRERR
jgi:AraC-like DNA-binding protein